VKQNINIRNDRGSIWLKTDMNSRNLHFGRDINYRNNQICTQATATGLMRARNWDSFSI
jgi:hypothetical protein